MKSPLKKVCSKQTPNNKSDNIFDLNKNNINKYETE